MMHKEANALRYIRNPFFLFLVALLAIGLVWYPITLATAPSAVSEAPPDQGAEPAPPEPEPEPEPEPPPPPARITIAAVGDLLIHSPLLRAAEQEDGTYDFTRHFADTAPYIQAADLAFANLEVPLAGPEWGYTGYPSFNSPGELARDARAAGFDVLTTANNHAVDKGPKGTARTLDYLDQYGLYHTGTFRTPEERAQDLIINVNGIRIGVLAYTYGTNGLPVPEPYLVNLLDPAQVEADMARLRPKVDLLVLCLHWGHEYQTEPSPEQVALADRFLAAGADVILGGHPHVLQRAEIRQVGDRKAAIIYSLGNFLSNQFWENSQDGVIFFVDVEAGKGVVGARYLPTAMHRWHEGGKLLYRAVPVETALASADPTLTDADRATLQAIWERTTERLPGTPDVKLYPAAAPQA